MLKNYFWIICLLAGIANKANGQSFGGNIWGQKWQQLNQEDIRVIYPEGFDEQALRVFSVLGYLHANHRSTVGDLTDKISLVLNNRSNISNGYVGLSPFRSEFYTTPLQNNFALGSIPWLDLLAVHEYRHVLQFSNARRGLNRFLSVAFGQTAYAGGVNIAIPDWYFEGDAVMAETAMTPQGRGRIPNFLRAYKAYELTGKRFSYDKVRNGSYKDFIPDHYRVGYMMNKYGAEQYGSNFWGEVIAEAGAFKGLFYPFSNAIKARTGKTTKDLYKTTFDTYRDKWKNETGDLVASEEGIINDDTKVFTNYRFPFLQEDGSLIYLKSGLRDIHTVYQQDGDNNRRLLALGLLTDPYIDVRAGKISWTEIRFHPSRGNIDYNVVMTYDIARGSKVQISAETRYFSPSIHPNGDVIAVVEVDEKGQSQIKIISSRDGLVLDSLINRDGHFITYPKWNTTGSSIIYAARDAQGKMAICEQQLNESTARPLSSWSYRPIGVPHVTQNHIYFSRSANDAEHIYRVDQGGREELIIQSMLGAYFPNVINNEILFSTYTHNGLRVQRKEIKAQPVEKSSLAETTGNTIYSEYGGDIINTISNAPSESKNYGKLTRPINIHSWGVTADDQSGSILIESDNILNSVSLFGGLQYIFETERTLWIAGAKLGFIYPNLRADYTLEARSFIVPDDGRVIDFNEQTISLGAEMPFNISSGPYIRSILPHFSLQKIFVKGDLLNDFDIFSQELGVLFLNRRIKAHQDVLAKYSQFVNLNFRSSLDDRDASQLDIESEYSFPGFLSNHAIRLELDYKSQPRNSNYNFPNRFDFARGYPSSLLIDMIPVSTSDAQKSFRFGANYHLPLFYPEFGLLGLGYLKRIQANVFYDHSRLKINGDKFDFSSAGLELLFDTQVFNTLPVTFGIRYARTLDLNTNEFEFFIPFYRF